MHYSNIHVKKFSWHKNIHDQNINSVTCAKYIQVFIVSYLIKYYDIRFFSDDVSNHSCVNYRVCCETVHYLVHIAISYL